MMQATVAPTELRGERAARLYASAIVAARAQHAGLESGDIAAPSRLPRIAARIVEELESGPSELVALAVAAPKRDRAETAAATAVLAAHMTMLMTQARSEPTLIATVALMGEAGRSRLNGGAERQLSEEELDRLAPSGVIASVQLGHLSAASRQACAVEYEARASARTHRLGPVYAGRQSPLMLSRVLAVVRTFVDQLAAAAGRAGPAEVLAMLVQRASDKTESALAHLLIGATGMFAPGTTVELNTKEIAVVMNVPRAPIAYGRPVVRIVFNHIGELCAPPVDVDLSAPGRSAAVRHIRAVFRANDMQAALLRGHVLEARAASALKVNER